MAEQHRRICPFCEATCGLLVTTEGRTVTKVEGDPDDPFSSGYICPKGAALGDFDADPDRITTPLIRENGGFREASWDEAFTLIDNQLANIKEQYGRKAIGAYAGNPSIHNLSLATYIPGLLKALGSPNIFSASTVDQIPKQLAAAAMFGTGLSVPIPDIDRTDYMLIIGANPLVSNGSMMTAPDFVGRLKALKARGGKIVVIDPRFTQTAKLADTHYPIRPGADAYFLFAIVHTLYAEGLVKPGALAEHCNGLDDIEALAQDFSPEVVANRCGIDAETIRQLARDIAAAPSATVYGRIGTCTQAFGTLASWLPDVIHILTGNMDREGGVMFTKPAHGPGNCKGEDGVGHGLRTGRRQSRVRGRDELFGEFPVACMAEEIDTPGEEQIRALITIAGNPVLSTPNSERLDKAMAGLDFMVSVDVYLNETTRHAHVILPGVSPLEGSHYDLAFSQLAVHNFARFSEAMFPVPEGQLDEWEVLLRLMGIVAGMGPNGDVSFLDTMVITTLIQRETALPNSLVHGRETEEILAGLAPRVGPDRVLDFMLRTGPYGEGFGANPDGLSLDKVIASRTGIDLGPLAPRIPEMLRTPSGKIEVAPPAIVNDVARLRASLQESSNGLVLIGRRHVRSNNSWLHNIPMLVKGKDRCTLVMHPVDAAAHGLEPGTQAKVRSRVGEVTVPVEISDAIMQGVVSMPHGWGHDLHGVQQDVAEAHAGVNSNVLTDESLMDEPSGNAVLCGIPVEVEVA